MGQPKTSSIRKFWRRLKSSVHPDDAEILYANPSHTFNLNFPPPAFIGDVDRAPVVILMANGGYNSRTPLEFPSLADHQEHLEFLWGTRTKLPQNFSDYYERGGMLRWVKQGKAVIVNAIAYRSPKITDEPFNQKLAKRLLSGQAHKQWLREEVLPAAERGDRLVIAHRCGLWNFSKCEAHGLSNTYHSRCPASPYLSKDMTKFVNSWLIQKGFQTAGPPSL